MSSGSAPCQGFVLEATIENFKKLNIYYMGLIRKYSPATIDIKKGFDIVLEVLANDQISIYAKVAGKKIEIEVMKYDEDDGDMYDDLEHGRYYLVFEEDDLYDKVLTQAGTLLSKKGILPESKMWTHYG